MSGWVDQAACREYPTGWWYPEPYDALAVAVAQAICRTCPVARQCVDEALDVETVDVYGIRGGLTPDGRRQLARTRRRTTTAAAVPDPTPTPVQLTPRRRRGSRPPTPTPLHAFTRRELLDARARG